jgi:formate hydrogenlyase transcriptional activator
LQRLRSTLATESIPAGATVLIVDDEPSNVDLLEQVLESAGYGTLSARGGAEALVVAEGARPDLILLDVRMSGIDGYETCRRLKAHAALRAIPVIFLTALTDTFEKVRAFSVGAVDYVTKPFEPGELLARVGTHVALRREIDAHLKTRATVNLLVEDLRHGLVGRSAALRRVREQIAQVAPTDSTVLVHGETGTGKELVARAIHDASRRRERPLVTVNCAAIPRELVESELFGHEKGAFSGATQQRRGRFELADGGTLFLDEIGELPLDAQPKLLRVLQSGEFDRVGGTHGLRSDVRVIAATNRKLQAQVAAGAFRSDLYYRLNVFPIAVPPLRERREDIPDLVRHFAATAARKLGRGAGGVAPELVEQALAYDWPGNIRELENLVERAMITSNGSALDTATALMAAAPHAPAPAGLPAAATLEEIERAHIRAVLERAGWVIEGERGAARMLGLHASTLRGRLRKLGIRKTS